MNNSVPTLNIGQLQLGFFSEGQSAYIADYNDNAEKLKLDTDGIEYFFAEPVLVTTMELSAEKNAGEIIFEVQPMYATSFTTSPSQFSANVFICELNKFITGFKIKSSDVGFFEKSPRIVQLRVNVISATDARDLNKTIELYNVKLKDVVSQINDIENREKRLLEERESFTKDVQHKTQKLNEEIAIKEKKAKELSDKNENLLVTTEELSEAISQKEEELKALTEQNVEVNNQMMAADNSLKDMRSKEKTSASELQKINEEIKLKNTEVSKLQAKLIELHNDTSLFADDMQGFAKHGDSQITKYLFLISFLISFAVYLSYVSIESTRRVFETYIAYSQLGVWNLLAIKSFLLIFMGFAFTFVYQVAVALIKEVFAINKKRLKLSEITILAKDICEAGLHDITLSDHQKLTVNMTVRMSLIRDYLAGKFEATHENASDAIPDKPSVATENEFFKFGNFWPKKKEHPPAAQPK